MTAITKAAYLELEDFIYKQCGKQVKPLNHKQIQMIRTPMIKCREWMNQDLLSTFFKFVSTSVLQYSQHISKAEALELYHRLLSLIAYGSQKAKILLK